MGKNKNNNKMKKQKAQWEKVEIENRIKPLEELLNGVMLCITDKVLYFPCISNRPSVEYPNFSWWKHDIGKGALKHPSNTLYLPVAGKEYNEIATNLYEALTGTRVKLDSLNKKDKNILYNTITKNPSYERCKNL